jgi:hypothetical protein
MDNFDGLFETNKAFSDDQVEGRDYYLTKGGYRVMTKEFLTKRGYCCGNGCKHCPYWPNAQKGNTKLKEG